MTQATVERPWARWYGLQRWRDRAALQMKLQPLCCMCLKQNKVTPAYVADHIIPHHGNASLFWYGELQSLCAAHHSSSKAMLERGGVLQDFDRDIGVDGWPIDKKHPVYNK